MKSNSFSSIVLELNNNSEKSQPKLKIPLSKLNLKAETTRSNLPSGRDSPGKQSHSKMVHSARNTSNQFLGETMREPNRLEEKIENPRFGGLPRASSVPRKALPKLYTENLQKKVSEKLDNLKDKYGVLYKHMLKAHGINVEKEDIRQIMKKSKPIFDKTYSIKYFGAMNSEFGIVSQRIPIQSASQDNNTARPPYNVSPGQFVIQEVSTAQQSKHRESKSNSVSESAWNTLDNFASVGKDVHEKSNIIKVLNEDFIHEQDESKQIKEETAPKSAQKNKRVVIYPLTEDMKFQLVPANPKKPIRSITDLENKRSAHFDSVILSERPRRQASEVYTKKRDQRGDSSIEQPQEIRVITNYALPKKIEAVKKRRSTGKELNKEKNPDFGRVSMEIEPREGPFVNNVKARVKGVAVGLASREYIDELNIPEKFRTHEIKALLSARTNYSYSKLLATVNSKEKPEDILIENTRKIEEIRTKREEMKRAHAQLQNERKGKGQKKSYSPQNRTPTNEGDIKLEALKGPFQIRITEPMANPMYNAFSKIRERIDNEDFVVDY